MNKHTPKLDDLDPVDRARAATLLRIMAEAQTALWDASFELEEILGFDIDTTNDLDDLTLEDLVEMED
jgi:hypothetical protein